MRTFKAAKHFNLMTEEKHFEKSEKKISWFREHPVWTVALFSIIFNMITDNSQSDFSSDKTALTILNLNGSHTRNFTSRG